MEKDQLEMDYCITLNGKKIDLAKALPLTVADWRELKRQGVVLTDLRNDDPDIRSVFCAYVVKKAGGDPADIEIMTMGELDKLCACAIRAEKVDRNFLTLSTSLQRNMGGG